MATKTKKPKKAAKPKKPLTAAQKKAAAVNKDPLYQPGAPLAGTVLQKAAGQITDLQYKPKVAALDTQAKTEKTQGTALIDRATGYYRNVALDAASRLAHQQALGQELDTRLKTIDTDTSSELAATPTPKVGTGTPGLSGGADEKFATELAAQRARAASTAAAYRTGGAEESTNWSSLENAMAGSRVFHGDETQKDLSTRLANRLSAIGQEKKTLQASRGDLLAQNTLNLRKSSFEDLATWKGLGIKESAIKAQAAASAAKNATALSIAAQNNATKSSIAASSQATTLAAAKISARAGKKLTASQKLAIKRDKAQRRNHTGPYAPAKSGKGAKESQSSKNTKFKIDNARSSIRTYRAQGLTGPQITKKGRKAGIPGVVLNAARDLEYLGYISAPNLAALHRAGVKINRNGH